MNPRRSSIVVSDFDGTITNLDTGVLIVDKFATGDWKIFDKLYDLNEMPIEEVIRRQFSMVKATKRDMIRVIDKSIVLRPGFEELVEVCDLTSARLVIASYGLDFCINHILQRAGMSRRVEIYAPRTRLTRKGLVLTFPKLRLKDSVNLKDDLVRYYKRKGSRIVFVGDGTSDFPAARNADTCFAIRGSRLAELCDKHGVKHTPITSFDPVIESIRSADRGN